MKNKFLAFLLFIGQFCHFENDLMNFKFMGLLWSEFKQWDEIGYRLFSRN